MECISLCRIFVQKMGINMEMKCGKWENITCAQRIRLVDANIFRLIFCFGLRECAVGRIKDTIDPHGKLKWNFNRSSRSVSYFRKTNHRNVPLSVFREWLALGLVPANSTFSPSTPQACASNNCKCDFDRAARTDNKCNNPNLFTHIFALCFVWRTLSSEQKRFYHFVYYKFYVSRNVDVDASGVWRHVQMEIATINRLKCKQPNTHQLLATAPNLCYRQIQVNTPTARKKLCIPLQCHGVFA